MPECHALRERIGSCVTIQVFQGESEMVRDNRAIDRFELSGLPTAPRGVPQIEVAFNVDSHGEIAVTARDLATGKRQSVARAPRGKP